MDENSLNLQNDVKNITELPNNITVAMAYVPYQNPTVIYSDQQGIKRGTLFPCLDKPFLGCEVKYDG